MKPISKRVSSSTQAAAQAWAAAMCARKTPCVMTPWDETTHFNTPLVATFTITGIDDQIVAASNPMRIGIIFSISVATGNDVLLNPGNGIIAGNNNGIRIIASNLPLVILHKDTPGLPQSEWHAFGISGGSFLTVIEIVLRDWPVNANGGPKNVSRTTSGQAAPPTYGDATPPVYPNGIAVSYGTTDVLSPIIGPPDVSIGRVIRPPIYPIEHKTYSVDTSYTPDQYAIDEQPIDTADTTINPYKEPLPPAT